MDFKLFFLAFLLDLLVKLGNGLLMFSNFCFVFFHVFLCRTNLLLELGHIFLQFSLLFFLFLQLAMEQRGLAGINVSFKVLKF